MDSINIESSSKKIYKYPRSFEVLDIVGLCPLTRKNFVETLFSLPKTPASATISLVGIPAVVSAIENPDIAKIYNSSTMSVIDGMPFVKKARKMGYECERCSGPDIMGMVFEESIKRGASHFFYGGKDDYTLQKLLNNIQKKYPEIKIAGSYSPPFRKLTKEEDISIVNKINSVAPDFLWVGIGAPKQELWMHEHKLSIKNTCMLGVGAAFDFLSGTLPKAPSWMENAGLEWLFRLIKEPKRLWRRYILGGIKYLIYCFKFKVK